MSKKTLESLKAAWGADDSNQGSRTNFTNKYYPFWDMPTNQRCVIRFLPDLNENNPRGFMVEKVFHNLTVNGKKESVPCLSMYGETDCPICKLSQDYYKTEGKDSPNGKKYWRKKQYIAQAIVIEDPIPADAATGETHAGKVRYFALGYQIHNIIKDAFASTDEPLESIPYEFKDGYDFVIKKTEKGGYADYTVGTKFLSRQRSLTEDEIAAASEGMVDLATLLPKHPGMEKVQAYLHAELNGTIVPEGKIGGDEEDDTPFEQATPVAKPAAAAPAAAPKATTPAPAATASDSSGVDDMLEVIRRRRAAAAAAQ